MGKVKKSVSKGTLCKACPRCKLSRARTGTEVVMSKPCEKCHEWKCRAHCQCARQGNLQGHQLARAGTSAPSTQTQNASSLSVAGPVGRAPAPSCTLLTDATEMMEMACREIENASEVEAASYQYDSPKLHAALMTRLKGRRVRPFTLNLYVDRGQLGKKVLKSGQEQAGSKMMKSRVAELRANGASVYVCKGKGPLGSCHPKGLVIDRRYLYCGSPNLTKKSEDNDEWPLRCTGEVVAQVLARLGTIREKHPFWDGKPL